MLANIVLSEIDVINVLKVLDVNKGFGPDDIPLKVRGKKCKVDNYRPISLLNSVSKVMERLVFNHIYPVVSPQINSAQHGFMKHRSTTTQLIDTYSDISRNLD